MKIGVISDTHLRSDKQSLPSKVFEVFAEVDHIFHLGDMCVSDVILELKALAPVSAVTGNMDPPDLQRKYDKLMMLEINDQQIILSHGHYGSGTTIENIKKKSSKADCIVFGHSHQPYNEVYQDTLLFNPGSPTDYKRSYIKRKDPSVGLLEVTDEDINGEIIYLNEWKV